MIFVCSEKFILSSYVAREAINLQDHNRVYRSRIPLAYIYAFKRKKSRHFSSLSGLLLGAWTLQSKHCSR